MRMLLTVQIPVDKGNEAIRDGGLPGAIERVREMLRPEAMYFTLWGGRRTALIVFDMADSSEMPAALEPLFMALDAHVELVPAMDLDGLRAGLSRLGG